MQANSQLSRIVLYQNLGFLGIMVIGYLDELMKLPTLLFSEHPSAIVHQRTVLDMLIVLAVWFLVSSSTRRILERIRYLEKFMRVCAWCRKIEYKGEWMRLEDFMKQGFDTPTTHGICPGCLRLQKEAIERRKMTQKDPLPGVPGTEI
ncbi:MAG TPA: hypothetical protein VFY06_06190 [Verrucomicrobiae bacterium]|nr:hypothetical protein [Verrucomicrobiae bacterium]